MKARRLSVLALLGATAGAVLSVSAARAQATLNICHINHPVQVANLAILEKWAKKQGISLNKTPTSYGIYLPKIMQMLTAGASNQCDIIWNNDDWGQDLVQYLTPMDDVTEIQNVAEGQLEPFFDENKKTTTV